MLLHLSTLPALYSEIQQNQLTLQVHSILQVLLFHTFRALMCTYMHCSSCMRAIIAPSRSVLKSGVQDQL